MDLENRPVLRAFVASTLTAVSVWCFVLAAVSFVFVYIMWMEGQPLWAPGATQNVIGWVKFFPFLYLICLFAGGGMTLEYEGLKRLRAAKESEA